jgi:hypothetical protein
MRSRPNASFGRATLSGACTSFDWATFSRGHSSFYEATFSHREVLRSPGVEQLCSTGLVPVMPTVKRSPAAHRDAGLYSPTSGSSTGTAWRRRSVHIFLSEALFEYAPIAPTSRWIVRPGSEKASPPRKRDRAPDDQTPVVPGQDGQKQPRQSVDRVDTNQPLN